MNLHIYFLRMYTTSVGIFYTEIQCTIQWGIFPHTPHASQVQTDVPVAFYIHTYVRSGRRGNSIHELRFVPTSNMWNRITRTCTTYAIVTINCTYYHSIRNQEIFLLVMQKCFSVFMKSINQRRRIIRQISPIGKIHLHLPCSGHFPFIKQLLPLVLFKLDASSSSPTKTASLVCCGNFKLFIELFAGN